MKERIKITIGDHVVLELPLWIFFILWLIFEIITDKIANHFITRYL